MTRFNVATQKGSHAGLITAFPIKPMVAGGQARLPGPGGGLISLTMLGQRGAFLASAELDVAQGQALITALAAALEEAQR